MDLACRVWGWCDIMFLFLDCVLCFWAWSDGGLVLWFWIDADPGG